MVLTKFNFQILPVIFILKKMNESIAQIGNWKKKEKKNVSLK